jgi:hypothetical protein
MVATWREPKYDWTIVDGVGFSDFNRIEEDIQYLKDELEALETGYDAAIDAIELDIAEILSTLGSHIADKDNPHEVTKEDLGLGELEEDTAYVKLAGDEMTGGLVGHIDTDYTTFRMRNIAFSTEIPEAGDGENGDIVMQYE